LNRSEECAGAEKTERSWCQAVIAITAGIQARCGRRRDHTRMSRLGESQSHERHYSCSKEFSSHWSSSLSKFFPFDECPGTLPNYEDFEAF
jgi:hypothetical protein